MTRDGSPRRASEINYTAQRTLRALEVVALAYASAPQVSAALGIHARTARRILASLRDEGYLEYRIAPQGRRRRVYVPTVRLLALAAQLAPRLPIVQHGRCAASALHRRLGVTAMVAIPCYADVLVIAHAGEHGPRLWALLPAAEHAAGRVLLAYREPWRHSHADPRLSDEHITEIRNAGHTSTLADGTRQGSLAVPVPDPHGDPIAALAIHGPSDTLHTQQTSLINELSAAADRLAQALAAA